MQPNLHKIGIGRLEIERENYVGGQNKSERVFLFSSVANRMVTMDANTPPEVMEEFLNLPPLTPRISILLWNTRGISRQGFRRNIHQLIS